MTVEQKLRALKQIIASYDSTAIAFSGGVDSTLLARVCTDILDKAKILLITAASKAFPLNELAEAKELAEFMTKCSKIKNVQLCSALQDHW